MNSEGECAGVVEWCTPIAHDNCGGDLTITAVASTTTAFCGILDDQTVVSGETAFPVGQSIITHTVQDDAGNKVTCQSQVEVIDTEVCMFLGWLVGWFLSLESIEQS